MTKKILVVLALMSPLLAAQEVSALPSAQSPTTEAVIDVFQDGNNAGDSTTGPAVPGTDNSFNNGVVKNLDFVTYEIEVSLNDADDTNLAATVGLNDKASWVDVPAICRTSATYPGLAPDSELLDTTGDGLNDTLVCNLGDHTEGTKVAFKATAQATGSNLDIIEASVEPTADNSASDRADGPVETEITASFAVNLSKTVDGIDPSAIAPAYNESDYVKTENVVGPDGSTLGFVIHWHVTAAYGPASELVASAVSDFTLTDTWVATHNANGNIGQGGSLLYDFGPGGTGDACTILDGNGSIICDQGGTAGSPTAGQPITFDLSAVDTQAPINGNLFSFEVKTWTPNSDLDDDASVPEVLTIENTVTLTDHGGLGIPLVSETGLVNAGSETGNQDYSAVEVPPGPINVNKSFNRVFGQKTGNTPVAKGQVVPAFLLVANQDNTDSPDRDPDGDGASEVGVCEVIDSTHFEYVDDNVAGWGFGYSTLPANASQPGFAGNAFVNNPSLRITESPAITLANNEWVDAWQINNGAYPDALTIQYSTDMANAACDSDIDGDGTENIMDAAGVESNAGAPVDWYEDQTMVPGYPASIGKIRVIWKKNYADIAALALQERTQGQNFDGIYYGFNLKVKETTPLSAGDYLPNIASYTQESWFGADTWFDPNDSSLPAWALGARGCMTDSADPNYSFNVTVCDRVILVNSSVSITKQNLPVDQAPVMPGDQVQFTVQPATSGATAAPVELTITDTLPAELEFISTDCSAVYPGCVESEAGGVITLTLPGHVTGSPLPEITITTTVADTAIPGTYENTVAITSDDADMVADSSPDGLTDYASIIVVAPIGVKIEKADSQSVIEPQSQWTTNLTYENLGGADLGTGHLIDVVSFNGDGIPGSSTERFNTENSGNANTETNTSDPDGQVEFVAIAPSSAGETFEYTTTDPALVDIRPCHPSNWPAGDVLGSGNATLDAICGRGLIDPGTDVPTVGQAGTGATDWTAAASLDVTAVRASLPAFPAGESSRTLVLDMNVDYAGDGDLLCNNFGLNTEIVTLDIISNDVCVEVVAGSIGDYIWLDANADGVQDASELPLEGVVVALLDGLGNPILDADGNPMTATTDASGNYLFEDLPSGDYQIVVDTSSLPAGLTQTYDFDGAGDNMSTTRLEGPATDPTLTDVEDDLDQDFGYTSPYDLALTKELASDTPDDLAPGDTVTFVLSVINQGTANAFNVGVVDYVPEGLTLVSGNGWVLNSDGVAELGNPIPVVSVGGTEAVTITFTIDDDATGRIDNFAEISSMFNENGEPVLDVDSLYDAELGNDIGPAKAGDPRDGVIDNVSGDEDDSDVASINLAGPLLAITGASTFLLGGFGMGLIAVGVLMRRWMMKRSIKPDVPIG